MQFSKLMVFAVFVLTLTGCASSPTHFASPDAENYRYTVAEGESIKIAKPEPRTIGFHEWEWEGKTSEIIDFSRESWSQNPEIPDNHMIAVQAYDPDIEGGRLIIPIQYVKRIKPDYDNSKVFHTIDGIQSPLRIDMSYDNYRERTSQLLREYSADGKFVGMVLYVKTNQNPMIDYAKMNAGDHVSSMVTERDSTYSFEFPQGEELRKGWEKRAGSYRKSLQESAEMRDRAERNMKAKERQVRQALAAEKPVGQMVCSLDKWIGVVEQNEEDRIKVSIIGRSSMSGEYLLHKDAPVNVKFDIDTTDEGKLRWMDSSKLGVCDIEIIR